MRFSSQAWMNAAKYSSAGAFCFLVVGAAFQNQSKKPFETSLLAGYHGSMVFHYPGLNSSVSESSVRIAKPVA